MSWKNIITKKKRDRRGRSASIAGNDGNPIKLVGASENELNIESGKRQFYRPIAPDSNESYAYEENMDEFDDSRESKEIATIRNKLKADAEKQVKEDSAKILAAELKRVTDLISGTSARKLIKLSAKGEVTLDML